MKLILFKTLHNKKIEVINYRKKLIKMKKIKLHKI